MSRPITEIAQELHASGLTPNQTSLLFELLAAKEEQSSGALPRSKRLPISALPPEWAPSPDHYEWAQTHGKGKSWVDSLAEDMRNWAASKGERRASWNGTFSTFMKRALEPRPVQQKLFAINGGSGKSMLGGGYA